MPVFAGSGRFNSSPPPRAHFLVASEERAWPQLPHLSLWPQVQKSRDPVTSKSWAISGGLDTLHQQVSRF